MSLPAAESGETYYPTEENLGSNCQFWSIAGRLACNFPKAELAGRTTCGGIVDDICLFMKDGRSPVSLTHGQIVDLKTRIPNLEDKSYLPHGNTL